MALLQFLENIWRKKSWHYFKVYCKIRFFVMSNNLRKRDSFVHVVHGWKSWFSWLVLNFISNSWQKPLFWRPLARQPGNLYQYDLQTPHWNFFTVKKHQHSGQCNYSVDLFLLPLHPVWFYKKLVKIFTSFTIFYIC